MPRNSSETLRAQTLELPSPLLGRDILVLSDDWHGLPTSTIHLFRQLLPHNRVFWLKIINRFPRLARSDVEKVTSVLGDWLLGTQRIVDVVGHVDRMDYAMAHPTAFDEPVDEWYKEQVTSSLYLAPITRTPMIIPSFYKMIRRLNEKSIQRTYGEMCTSHQIESPIVLTTFPSTADFMKSVSADLKIYYCVDDWINYPGFDRHRVAAMENELFETVDAVVATSRWLEKKKRQGCPSLYLPQGVDFDHFSRARDSNQTIPELSKIRKPIVGFFGLISEWVDLDLIKFLASEFTEVSFVLIGTADVSTESISAVPNIHQFGSVPYEKLPIWAKYFDVGLIPFLTNDLTRAVNPLKLMEYYALGLPVLSTRLPDLEDQAGPLFLAAERSEFRESLLQILCSDQESFSRQALSVARQQTWQHRVAALSAFIRELKCPVPN